MKFFQPTVILSLISSVVAYTTVDQVITDIINLDNAVKALDAAVQAYQGGLLSTVAPGISFVVVEARLTEGDTDSALLPPSTLSDSDTQDFIDTVASTLAIDNPKAVSDLIAKKPLFDAAGASPIIELGLQALLAGHLSFAQQILNRSPADKYQGVENVANIITVALQHGINTFAT